MQVNMCRAGRHIRCIRVVRQRQEICHTTNMPAHAIVGRQKCCRVPKMLSDTKFFVVQQRQTTRFQNFFCWIITVLMTIISVYILLECIEPQY
jgi:hypothetical protein